MDFTPEMLGFQGIIISLDNTYSFSKLTARGGNEEKIEHIIKSIHCFLEKEKYINEYGVVPGKETIMRKFALYLILNGDLPVLQEMVDMEGIHLVIWTIPTIPKCLLSEMLWKLHMEKFVHEAIAFCWPQLALEVASSLVDNLKYYTPSTCLGKLKSVSAACYRLLCRLHFFNFDNQTMPIILSSAFNNLQKCLNYFISPPNAGRLDHLTKDAHYKYKGNCLHAMLSLIYDCMEQYKLTQEFTSADFDEIYLLTFKVDALSSDRNSRSQDIQECLDKCNTTLLDKCKELVMDVSVDIFCAWSEFEENGNSMQQTIGDLCYKLRNQLLINSVTEHPVVTMIQQISCKPLNYEEVINETDSETITENIIKNKNKDEWVRALIHRDKLLHDVVLIEHLASNLDVLNNEQCYILYKVCQDYLKNHSENAERVELLATNLFQYCSNNAKYEILEERFRNNCFFDMTETTDFRELMTKVFNKLVVSPDSDQSDVLNVFIQSPKKVYMKIILLAAESSQQTGIMLRLVKLLEKFSNHYYEHETEPTLITSIQISLENNLNTEVKQQNFVKFIMGLKEINIISGPKLLLLIIMPSLYRGLINNDIGSINIPCRLLSEAYTLEELIEYRAPLLAMLAQVLEIVRWKIDTFVTLGPSTLQLVLQLQTLLFDTYNGGIPDNEASWLRNKLRNLQPMNLYYYRRLWNHTGNTFIETVSGMAIDTETEVEQLTSWLSLMICSSTQKEWCDIWDNLAIYGDTKTLDIIYKVLKLLTETEARNHTDKSWSCLLNCYRNFVYTIRYKFLKEPLTDEQVSTVINKIASLANLIEEDNIEDVGTGFMPLITYMVERTNDYAIDVPHLINDALKPSKFSDMVNKIFTNGTA